MITLNLWQESSEDEEWRPDNMSHAETALLGVPFCPKCRNPAEDWTYGRFHMWRCAPCDAHIEDGVWIRNHDSRPLA